MQTARRFLNRYASVQAFQEIKAKYCPDGQTCEVVIMLGFMIGMASFGYKEGKILTVNL